MKIRFTKTTFVILFLSVLMLAAVAVVMPVAKAQDQQYIQLAPTSGPAGTAVSYSLQGFDAGYPVSITFGPTNTNEGSVTPKAQYDPSGNPEGTSAGASFTIPKVTTGSYIVTATGENGEAATATFTVIPPPTPVATTAPSATPITIFVTPTVGLTSTTSPKTVSAGFLSPLTIGIILVVVALAIFVTAIYVRRGRPKSSSYQEASRYEPRPSTPSQPNAPSSINQPYQSSKVSQSYPYQPYQPSSINQPYQSSKVSKSYPYQPYQSSKVSQPYQSYPYQPYQSSKINQQATSIQQPRGTTVCRNCKRTVRDDLNICPYCSKRIK